LQDEWVRRFDQALDQIVAKPPLWTVVSSFVPDEGMPTHLRDILPDLPTA
jgi:hypothetical protein